MSVRPIAQQDPVPNLTHQYGERSQRARQLLANLLIELQHLDGLADTLNEHGVTVSVDLGPVGNAAAATRRDLERDSGKPTFSFPKPR